MWSRFRSNKLVTSTSKSVCFIVLTGVKIQKRRQNTNYKPGVIGNGKLDITIVRFVEKAVLYFTKIQFRGRNRWQGDLTDRKAVTS